MVDIFCVYYPHLYMDQRGRSHPRFEEALPFPMGLKRLQGPSHARLMSAHTHSDPHSLKASYSPMFIFWGGELHSNFCTIFPDCASVSCKGSCSPVASLMFATMVFPS